MADVTRSQLFVSAPSRRREVDQRSLRIIQHLHAWAEPIISARFDSESNIQSFCLALGRQLIARSRPTISRPLAAERIAALLPSAAGAAT